MFRGAVRWRRWTVVLCAAGLLLGAGSARAQTTGEGGRTQRRAGGYWAEQRTGGPGQQPVRIQRPPRGHRPTRNLKRFDARRGLSLVPRAKVTPKKVKKPNKFKGLRLKTRARLLVRRMSRSTLGQFAAGLFVDGPKESWHAIKRNPKAFAVGLCLTGACAVGGELLTLPAHQLLVGASGAAAGVEAVQIYRNEYRHAAAGNQRARIAGKILWLPSLVLATAVAGGALGTHAGEHTLGTMAQSFAGGVVTGGDMPTALVTAWQTYRNGKKPPRVELHTSASLTE